MISQLALNIRLRDDATFENYIGDAARKIQGTDRIQYLWGPSGSGKSHLLQALCHKANVKQEESIYLQDPGSHAPEILDSLESFSLVCLDDIHQITGDESWELELFHLMNSVKDGDTRLVVSASSPSARLNCVLPDLASRLRAAVAVETDALDDQQKLGMLKRRADNRGFTLNDEVARFILDRSPRDMHHLVGLLAKLEVETLRQQKKLTIPFVKKTLQL
jgi:DnaA-homolog protein